MLCCYFLLSSASVANKCLLTLLIRLLIYNQQVFSSAAGLSLKYTEAAAELTTNPRVTVQQLFYRGNAMFVFQGGPPLLQTVVCLVFDHSCICSVISPCTALSLLSPTCIQKVVQLLLTNRNHSLFWLQPFLLCFFSLQAFL